MGFFNAHEGLKWGLEAGNKTLIEQELIQKVDENGNCAIWTNKSLNYNCFAYKCRRNNVDDDVYPIVLTSSKQTEFLVL